MSPTSEVSAVSGVSSGGSPGIPESQSFDSSTTLPPVPRVRIARRVPLERNGALSIVDQLLRDRRTFVACIEDDLDLTLVAKTMIVTCALGAAIFGASIGAYRGGLQALYAAVKLPLVVLLTAGLTAPALSALGRVIQGQSSLRRDIVLVLSSLALGSMVIAALAPVMWLFVRFGASYHQTVMLAVGCCAAGGVMGLGLFIRGLADRGGRGVGWVGVIALSLFALVGTQMTWTMRPYLLRPRTEGVPFMRAREGSFLDSVERSSESARGVFSRERAPLPGEEGESGE